MDEGPTIHGVGVAGERRVEGLTRALDVPDDLPTQQVQAVRPTPVPVPPPVLASQDAPWRGELKRAPQRYFASSIPDPETTIQGRHAPVVGPSYEEMQRPTTRLVPRSRIIALFVGGVLFGLVLGAIVVLTALA